MNKFTFAILPLDQTPIFTDCRLKNAEAENPVEIESQLYKSMQSAC